MTNSERAKVSKEALVKIADQIEDIRLELYSYSVLDEDDDKTKIDDELFSIQSKLRYGIAEMIGYYENIVK